MGLIRWFEALGKSLTENEGKGVWDYYRESSSDRGSNQFRDSSVPLPDGGDTHFHRHDEDRAVTVTTRLPGCPEADHITIRDPQTFNQDATGDSRTPEDLTGFRAVFGDDNDS